MDSTIYQYPYDAFRTLIPLPHERIPITKSHWPYAILPFVPFTLMAYLARRPDTYTLRLLLLPVVLTLVIGTAFRFMWVEPELNVYNWGQGLLAEAISTKAIDYAWRKEGMLKVGERRPGLPEHPSKKHNTPAANGLHNASPPPHSVIPSWFRDAFELMFSMRGLGWKYGAGVHVPKEHRPLGRSAFLRSTFIAFLKSFLIFDFLESLVKLVPNVGTPQGGSIFFESLPLPQRFVVSTAIHVCTGCCILAGFEMIYDLVTLFSVIALGSPTSSWPPIMDHPWQSDSLHIFWAKRWHQVLRETFFVLGGHPGRLIAGNPGVILGTFIGSGLYHECAAYAMGLGFDSRVPLFFAIQAPLLIVERAWRKTTGHRVGGIYGRLWVYFCIIVLGQPLVDSWHTRGLGGGLIVPPFLSPARRLVLPFLQHLAQDIGVESFISL
ncbi:hypothetical protein BV22DRAFT_209734 [Leucogyrophana mollusca]|uniref:Uncharacterized protein n=1 Tax=Leucogyrophana mollusca TaxID=85980 RepID=A0ACB8BST9_9AGAM|nr:hypothetical protein BV22DRAFT_209734 [Leucogyrophana mollusca]